MSDKTSGPGDDAPLSASKAGDASRAFASEIDSAKGEAITGRAVTINRPVEEVFATFRDFSNLPRFMENVERIELLDGERSNCVVTAPGGRSVEWDARVTAEQPNRSIEWTSEEGADVPNSGRVTFQAVEGRGTVVTATILYDPPGGAVGKLIAKMFQREPAIQARRDLRRFKQFMETGEVATSSKNQAEFEEYGV